MVTFNIMMMMVKSKWFKAKLSLFKLELRWTKLRPIWLISMHLLVERMRKTRMAFYLRIALQMWTQNTMAQQPAEELQEAPLLLSDASINLLSSLSPQASTFVSPLSPQHGSAQAAP